MAQTDGSTCSGLTAANCQGGDGRELGGGIALLGERFAGGIEDGAAHGLGRWLFASLGHFSRQLERHDVHGKASLKRAKP